MSSLDRLIDLAKQTGSKLIVHDPIEGRDLAILSIDEFERLALAGKSDAFDFRGLSGSEMLDKINRDISVWRARREEDEDWEKGVLLDEEMEKELPFDPFQEMDSHTSAWHSAGAVLEDRYGRQLGNDFDSDDSDDTDEDEEEEIDFRSFLNTGGNNEIEIEDVSFGSEQKTTQIPLAKNEEESGWSGSVKTAHSWKEEPLLEEEPVFYEEPV